MGLKVAFTVVFVSVVVAVKVAVAALDEGDAQLVAAAPLARQAHRVVHAAERVYVEALAELEVELAVPAAARGVQGVLDGVAARHGLLAQRHAHLSGQALVAVPGLAASGLCGGGGGGRLLGDHDRHEQRRHGERRGVGLRGRRGQRDFGCGGGGADGGGGGGYHSRGRRRRG